MSSLERCVDHFLLHSHIQLLLVVDPLVFNSFRQLIKVNVTAIGPKYECIHGPVYVKGDYPLMRDPNIKLNPWQSLTLAC